MRRLVNWYDAWPAWVRLAAQSFLIAVPFYLSGLLEQSISSAAEAGGLYPLAAHASVLIVIIAFVVFVGRSLASERDKARNERDARRKSLMQAYTHIDRVVSAHIAAARALDNENDELPAGFCVSVDSLQRIVQATYSTFESAFGSGLDSDERTDFEVTFMTQSYIDDKITIPACANREGRAPRSMVLRQQGQDDIYDSTVTAQVYRETRPSVHIIPSTGPSDYSELYAGQKERIRSSIVFPVLSDANELLGTLVVHCDKENFFRPDDQKYWCDVLEIFAKRIALAKTRMDFLWRATGKASRRASIGVPRPWF